MRRLLGLATVFLLLASLIPASRQTSVPVEAADVCGDYCICTQVCSHIASMMGSLCIANGGTQAECATLVADFGQQCRDTSCVNCGPCSN